MDFERGQIGVDRAAARGLRRGLGRDDDLSADACIRRVCHAGSRRRPGGSRGHAGSSGLAAALARAGELRVTLTGPGIRKVTAACRWAKTARQFRCTVTIPRGVRTGKARYKLTADENPLLGGFVTVPAVKKAIDPEKIGFL
jgi:hypothetical protein